MRDQQAGSNVSAGAAWDRRRLLRSAAAVAVASNLSVGFLARVRAEETAPDPEPADPGCPTDSAPSDGEGDAEDGQETTLDSYGGDPIDDGGCSDGDGPTYTAPRPGATAGKKGRNRRRKNRKRGRGNRR